MAIKLPSDNTVPTPSGRSVFSRHKKLLLSLAATLFIGSHIITHKVANISTFYVEQFDNEPLCGKIDPLVPSFRKSVDLILNDLEYKKASIKRLSGAVKIPTVVQDINPDPNEDPDFYANFPKFHEYLKTTFPLVHENLKLELVNKFGLLYTWKGTNDTMKPVLLMSHQDVVPVNEETWDEWKFPPFSGHYDSETDTVWGRGSNDCKNLVIAQFEAIERLLHDGYTTERTVMLALGFDEESSGQWGAGHMSSFLQERYGENGIFMIVDEGEGVIQVDENVFVATPVNTEKGYVDVEVTLWGHGGHSSVPPDHTNIGIIAELITLLEAHPFNYDFEVDNPVYGLLSCKAEHARDMSDDIRKIILGAARDNVKKQALNEWISNDKLLRDLIRTTLAVDIIHGGVKSNALPEQVKFVVNHRIDIHSSINATVENDLKFARQIAEKHNFGLSLNGEMLVPETENGYINLDVLKPLAPAPVSPTSGPAWDILAGTAQNLFENDIFKNDPEKEFYVTTGLSSGNTDTKWYWPLSENIYRFIGAVVPESSLKSEHSVNEHMSMDAHLSAIAFVYEFIVNINEYGADQL